MPIALRLKTFFKTFKTWIKSSVNGRRLLILGLIILGLFLIRGCYNFYFPKKEVFVVARDATWYPLNFFGKEKNVVGFSDELLLEIARIKDFHVNIISAPPGDLLEYLDEGQTDGILSSLTPDVILNEQYLFSEPYYSLGAVLIVDLNSPIKGVQDLQGKYLGVMRGSPVLFNIGIYPSLKVVTYDSQTTMLEDIVRDRIDAAILNQLTAYSMVNGYFKGRLQVITKPLTQEGLRLVTHRGMKRRRIVEDFNEGLEEIRRNGTYQKLLSKWDLTDPTNQ